MTSLARRNVEGDSAAARAKFVRGPMAIRVIVSGGLESRMWRISWCDGRLEGVKRVRWVDSFVCVASTAVAESMVDCGGASNMWDQVSLWLVWCGCFR